MIQSWRENGETGGQKLEKQLFNCTTPAAQNIIGSLQNYP